MKLSSVFIRLVLFLVFVWLFGKALSWEGALGQTCMVLFGINAVLQAIWAIAAANQYDKQSLYDIELRASQNQHGLPDWFRTADHKAGDVHGDGTTGSGKVQLQ